MNDNFGDTDISDRGSNYAAAPHIRRSNWQPGADEGHPHDYVSLVDNYNRLARTVGELERSLSRLQKRNNELNEFIGIGAHEMKAPIMPILGIAEILLLELEEAGIGEISIRKDQIESIIRNAQKLAKISSEILDVTKIENQLLILRKQDFDLNEVILETIDDYKKNAAKKNVKIIYQRNSIANYTGMNLKGRDESKTFIFADKTRIAQVISNLLSNAIRYTKSEGNISVYFTKKLSEVNLSSNNKEQHEDSESIINITDSGSGIDPGLLKNNRLFTKFGSNESSGTGLGLYISKKIIEAHGGRIWAQNNTDKKGASFTFTLPLRISC